MALTFPWIRSWIRRHPAASLFVLVVPYLGYAMWALVATQRVQSDLARLHSLITIAAPALLVAVPLVIVALVDGYVRAPGREDRVAIRLVLLGVATAVAIRVLLGDLPQHVTGQPLVPWYVLALLLTPTVLACLVTAMLRYRLDDIEPSCAGTGPGSWSPLRRRRLLGAVGRSTWPRRPRSSPCSSAAWSLSSLLPLAFGLRRFVSGVVYGDREFPYRVVSELRRLDPLTAPEDALQETLTVLARRLRLSYAAIEVYGAPTDDRIADVDRRAARAADVRRAAGRRAPVGRLQLEVEPGRDPSVPRDRRLLEDVGSQVGALVQAVSINRELQRSRQHLVAAREEERRRVRRDLHDGLGRRWRRWRCGSRRPAT